LDKKIERSHLKQQQMEQAMAVWCDKLTNYRKIVSIGLISLGTAFRDTLLLSCPRSDCVIPDM